MISQDRYVRVTSGVGAGNTVAQRQLILRIMTQNALLPPGVVDEMSGIDAVGSVFGPASEEYKRSQAYFAFISKAVNSPTLISFARWVSTDIAPSIYGDSLVKSLAALKAIVGPTLTLSVNGVNEVITGISFTAATSLTDVASELQTAIRGAAGGQAQLTNATVTYNTNTNQFNLTGGVVGQTDTVAAVSLGTATDISPLLGWTTTGTVNVPGQVADTPDQAAAKSAQISDNFGSFLFTNAAGELSDADKKLVAQWNDAQNNKFMYLSASTVAGAGALYALCGGLSGMGVTLVNQNLPNDYSEQSPAEILAATNYTLVNAAQNYMFYPFAARNVTVSDDTVADQMDSVRANYIGQTQTAGQKLAFYQRGLLYGGPMAAVDMNVYANEMWLKSAIIAQILTLLLNLPEVPANKEGKAILIGTMQPIIETARNNGVISVGKTITTVQQQYITQLTGDQNAWRQISSIGYWLNVDLSPYVNNNTKLTEWKASYTLIYAKGDAIRYVEGRDIMI